MSIAITDAATLRAAVERVNGLPDDGSERTMAARRQVIRRARSLNLAGLIPAEWSTQTVVASAPVPEVKPTYETVLASKAEASGLPVDALRKRYVEAVREFAMMPEAERPPFSREIFAQSKVNTLIREADAA